MIDFDFFLGSFIKSFFRSSYWYVIRRLARKFVWFCVRHVKTLLRAVGFLFFFLFCKSAISDPKSIGDLFYQIYQSLYRFVTLKG